MALPCGTTGSLYPTFVPDRLVGLTVKLASAIALPYRLPSGMSQPWETSVTLSEVTTPVKLPTKQGPDLSVRTPVSQGRYFKVGSRMPGDTPSTPPAYPTHD
jgi:hypothetical protein